MAHSNSCTLASDVFHIYIHIYNVYIYIYMLYIYNVYIYIYIYIYIYYIYIIYYILCILYSATLDILGYKKLRNEANSEIVIFTHQVVGIPVSP